MTMMQDMLYLKKPISTKTTACSAECYICGKGLLEGYSVTAKTLPNGIVLFCDIHYSLQ